MDPMIINNNQMINQMNQNQIFQTIQKNNEKIIQMIQQIFQVQMLNNMLLRQIINNNLNNNINNNMFNDIMNNMNNMNMINNPNIQMMNNNMMNNPQNNETNPWAGNNASRINITFLETGGLAKILIAAPEDISIEELIEAYFQRNHITNLDRQNNFNFIHNGKRLKRSDRTLLKEKFYNIPYPSVIVTETEFYSNC